MPGATSTTQPPCGVFAGLRVRLMLLVLLAVLPALAILLHAGGEARDDAWSRARESAVRAAQGAAVQGNQILSDAEPYVELLAQHPLVRGGDRAAQSDLFQRLLAGDARYVNIGLIGLDGAPLASARSFAPGTQLGDRRYFRQALATGRPSLGEYQIGRIHGQPSINVGVPVRDAADATTGVLFVAIRLDFLDRLPTQVEFPAGSVVTLLDTTGLVLSRSREPSKFVGRRLPDAPLVRAVTAGGAGDARIAGLDGATRLYAWVPVLHRGEPTGGFVVVGIDAAGAEDAAAEETVRNVAMLAAAAVLALAVAWFAGGLLVVRRARELAGVTERIAAGDLAARAGPPYGAGEMGELARSVDAMGESLAKREAEVLAAEERFRSLVERTPAVFYSADAGGEERSVHVGPEIGALLGFSAESWRTDAGLWLRRLHPEDRDRVLAEFRRAAGAGGSFTLEYRLLGGDDRPVWVRDTGSVRAAPGGGAPRVTGLVVDVTEARAFHDRMLRVQETEAAARVAVGAAHEVEEAVAAIRRRASAVLAKVESDAALRDHVLGIERAAERAADLAGRLRAFGGGAALRPEETDPNRLVERLEAEIREAAGGRADVRTLLEPEVGIVAADPARLSDALRRLAAHAVAASPKGGTVTIGTARVVLDEAAARRIAGARSGDFVVLGVSDSGPGCDEDAAARAFDPWPAGSKAGGLDLAAVAGFARQSGGFVVMTCVAGKGATRKLHLPALPPRGATSA